MALLTHAAAAQDALDADAPLVAVTGVGRVLVAPNQAVVTLGATVQRGEARQAQRELDAVMQDTIRSMRELGIRAEHVQTASLSLQPVYAERADVAGSDAPGQDAAARRDEPRIVAYRATNVAEVTVRDLEMIGAVVDAGIAAGVNEIRGVSFGLADELPYRVTALERAVDAARRKARAAASALGVTLGEPLEVRERDVAVPYRQLDVAFAGAERGAPIAPGEIAIEATVEATFGLGAASVPGD